MQTQTQTQTQNISIPELAVRRAIAILCSTGKDIYLSGIEKGGEHYFFLYDHENYPKVLKTLGRFASDPELSFTWPDAAVLFLKTRGRNNVTQKNTGGAR